MIKAFSYHLASIKGSILQPEEEDTDKLELELVDDDEEPIQRACGALALSASAVSCFLLRLRWDGHIHLR